MRERPITAPNVSMYSQREVEKFKRKQSIAAQTAIYGKLHDLLQYAYNRDKSKTGNIHLRSTSTSHK